MSVTGTAIPINGAGATFKKKKKKVWHPIPRDRDQAFAKFDGLFPRLTSYLVIHLSSFDKKIPARASDHLERSFP